MALGPFYFGIKLRIWYLGNVIQAVRESAVAVKATLEGPGV